ncbi:MAG TPA: LytTR family DNA-binding domain-containing protein [Saprospiraceae bacterium]|nr:LytTR family DNA-binding domain-containing protein [Saprospiraceae bacterium]
MPIQCLIVDDDPMVCDLIKYYCSKSEFIQFCISANNGRDALDYLSSSQVDLIFLDFHLPDMKGQAFLELKPNKTPVIMITSESQFAVQSYEYHDVIDYVVKPISYDRFEKAIKKFQFIKSDRSTSTAIKQDHMFIKEGSKLVKILFDDLLFVKSEENYVQFVCSEKSYLSLITLREVEEKLPLSFQRIHRSYIVNTQAIKSVGIDSVELTNHQLPLSNSYKKELKARLDS